MNNDIKPKITYKDHFLPTFLTDLIIKDSSMRVINIEEEKSELYYKTLNGYGKIIFKNNSEYDGFMKYGILESDERSCTFKFANGTEYKGELRQNQLTGYGEYSFPSGATYKGQVKNGLRNGKGVYEYAKEGLIYEGEWMNGLKHGKGILSVKDQMLYEGEFFEGIRQGFGKIEWVTKNIYEGYFKNNNIHGNGYMIWKNSYEKYIGQWVNNSQNGLGVHVWYEHKGEQKFWRNRYVGEMKNGNRNGYGVFFYANGGRYEGMWENNMKNGFGIFTAHDGTQTIGKYINDRYDSSLPVNVQGANTTKTSNLNGTNNKLFGKGGKNRFTQKGVLQAVNEEEETDSILGQNNTKGGTENNTNNNGVSIKNENNETGITKQKNESALMSLSMIDSKSILNSINSKMMELNPFKSLLELSDIIEIDPDIEANIMDIQNLLLRHLSEMKYWYKFYVYNRDNPQLDLIETIPLTGHKLSKQYNEKIDKEALHEVLNKEQINEPVIDNNDFGYAMEMKDLWRFMRESFIVSSDLTLASFNRIFFRGPKNYIEMFHYPEDIKMYSDEFFEYMFQLIGRSKDDFSFKHRDKLKIHASVFSGPNDLGHLIIKPPEADNLFDIHNKRNNILLRHFYEAIIRIAYLKYNHLPETLQKKIKMLIDLIKTNPNFKKLGKKSNTQYTNDSSLNSTICVLDLKVRVLESNAEQFSKIYDRSLKTIFSNLFQKSSYSYKKNDKTITNRFFFQNLIKKSNLVSDIIDKHKFYEFLTIYHKDKIVIKEENRGSVELNKSIETILNNEMIYFEHCELLYLCCRFYLLHNNIPDRIDNYNDLVNQFVELSKTSELVFQSETYQYNYPKLRNHKILDHMIETENQRKLEEEKKRILLKMLENERSMMVIEDVDVLGQGDEEEENDYSDDSNPF